MTGFSSICQCGRRSNRFVSMFTRQPTPNFFASDRRGSRSLPVRTLLSGGFLPVIVPAWMRRPNVWLTLRSTVQPSSPSHLRRRLSRTNNSRRQLTGRPFNRVPQLSRVLDYDDRDVPDRIPPEDDRLKFL